MKSYDNLEDELCWKTIYNILRYKCIMYNINIIYKDNTNLYYIYIFYNIY